MPGNHAPKSSRSFYASLMRASVIGVVALGLIVVIVAVTLGSRTRTTGEPSASGSGPTAGSTTGSTTGASSTPTSSQEPSEETSASPSPSGPSGARSVISVLNGTDRNGLAARIRAKLLDEGYKRVTSANGDRSKRTTVFYRPGSQAVAEDLIALIPELRRAEPADASTPKGAVVIVLGSDFDG